MPDLISYPFESRNKRIKTSSEFTVLIDSGFATARIVDDEELSVREEANVDQLAKDEVFIKDIKKARRQYLKNPSSFSTLSKKYLSLIK